MMRRATTVMLSLLALTACGKKGARRSDFDSATAAALAAGGGAGMSTADMPKNPHVTGFDIGRSLDKRDMIFGGSAQRFLAGDSVLVSVRSQFVPAGADISGRIRMKNATLDSTGAKSGVADSTSTSYTGLRFAGDKKWVKGNYSVEIFLNGKFQMAQEFQVGQ